MQGGTVSLANCLFDAIFAMLFTNLLLPALLLPLYGGWA
jgi:hypothetical protein